MAAPVPAHVYHERQVKALCAVHALNNLFQQANAYSQETLDGICRSLDPDSWINGHKSFWGVGDYDMNVMDAALQLKGYVVQWFDKRMNPVELEFDNIFGFIFNVPSKKRSSIFNWLPLTSQRHWYSIRNLPSPDEAQQGRYHFYNLDSFLESPRSIGQRSQLVNFIREQVENPEKHLILVLTPEVAKDGSWRRPPPPEPTLVVIQDPLNPLEVDVDLDLY